MRPPSPGPSRNFFATAFAFGILLVEFLLDVGDQPVDLVRVVDVDQELHERPILSLGRVDEQEPQPAAADERRDVAHARSAAG